MENTILSRFKRGWNAFTSAFSKRQVFDEPVSYESPVKPKLTRGNERSIVTAVYNRIALDVAAIEIKHVIRDDQGHYVRDAESTLNDCLTLEANIDQSARAYIQDVVLTLLDEGYVAMVPVDTDIDPERNESFKIYQMRTGSIVEWSPSKVKVKVYNEFKGQKEEIVLNKSQIAIIQNPFYVIMNEPNSILQRLIKKLNLLDAIDEQSGAGKLDLIISLPYSVKNEQKKKEAEARRLEIENQLKNEKYGIAYIDGTEHITQLNRAVENNLMSQIEYLTNMFYSQLGISQAILDGTAGEEELLRYDYRITEPILAAITNELKRKFLTKTARTRGHSIDYFRNPFKLISISNIAEIADKMTRNEILSTNEIRPIIGYRPSDDPSADELRNKNINQAGGEAMDEESLIELEELNAIDSSLDSLEDSLMHYASKYYDPEYAHRYYEEHKHLKGRHSTAGLNEEGREHAALAKTNIYKERDSRIASSKNKQDKGLSDVSEQKSRDIEELKEEKDSDIETHKRVMESKIKSIQNRLKSMDSASKKANKEAIAGEINNLREENAIQKARILSKFGMDSNRIKERMSAIKESLKQTHSIEKQEAKDWADEQYDKELEQIKNNPNLQTQKKTTTKTSQSVRIKPYGT